jgi:BMFP domain-containing protein YqiC
MILPVFSLWQNSYNASKLKLQEIMMINAKKIEEIAKQVTDAMPSGVKNLATDFEEKAKTVLQNKLSQLDVVTREEFDVQTQVLIKTRAKITALEAKLAELEAKISAE